jgi:hypothetical protein
MQSAAEFPLFIASDVERGVGQQVQGCAAFPCQMAVAAGIDRSKPGDVSLLERGVMTIAEEAGILGSTCRLSPSLTSIKTRITRSSARAFSDKPGMSRGSEKYTEIWKAPDSKLRKAFSGHGDVLGFSHPAPCHQQVMIS